MHQADALPIAWPDGIRGFGPRRSSNYGRVGGPGFCLAANEEVIVIVQIEHIDAVNNLDEILAVPGLTSIVVGPNDLSGSMGHLGEPEHPDVLSAIDTVIAKARRSDVFVGIGIGPDLEVSSNGWRRVCSGWRRATMSRSCCRRPTKLPVRCGTTGAQRVGRLSRVLRPGNRR